MRVRNAYTLIEILIVMSIMSVLFLIGYANFRDYSKRQALVSVTTKLQADIRLAQAQAIEGKKPSTCSVNQPLDYYAIYFTSVTAYDFRYSCGGTITVLKTNTLPSDFQLTIPPLIEIRFKVLALGTNIPANTSVNIIITQTSTGKQSIVRVSDGGYVSVDESYVSLTPAPSP